MVSRSRRAALPAALSWAIAALLAVASAAHLTRGLFFLAVQQPPRAIADLRNRRIETAYFLDRVSPLSQQMLAADPTDAAGWAAGADRRWSHGVEHARGALPPWSYSLQLLIVPPVGETGARWYLAVLDVAALIAIACLAFVRAAAAGADTSGRALVVLSPLAIGATNSALTQGQNSLIINAALACVVLALLRRRDDAASVPAGVAFALAMTKPSTALLFALPPAALRRWRLLGTAAAVLAAATIAGAAWLGHPVLFQFRQFEQLSRAVVDEGANPLLNALTAATTPAFARNVCAAAGVAIAIAVTVRLRRTGVFAIFAVLAVVARLFTYHRAYDDVLLAFLVIEAAARATAPEAATRWRIAWLACGASLWLPYSLYVPAWAQGAADRDVGRCRTADDGANDQR